MRKINNYLMNEKFLKNSFYRYLIYKCYHFFKYSKSYFYKTESKILNLHKKNIYKNKIKKRYLEKKNLNIKIKYIDFKKFKTNLPNNLFYVDLNKMVSVIGSLFSDPEDPLVKTAKQLLSNENINFKNLALKKYLDNFQPKNYSEVFQIKKKTNLHKLSQYTFFYPWMHAFPSRALHNGLFGPKNFDVVIFRATRLKNIIKLINKYGYIPNSTDCIEGYILKNINDYRFVVTSGTHRSSVLNALKNFNKFQSFVEVKFDKLRVPNNYFIVDIAEINDWPGVKSGFISIKDASIFFKSFFNKKIYI